jgi:hypothetical protein
MIYLTKGQPLFDNSGFVVYDPTGYYNDGDTVICAPVGAPDEPACRYEAQYIAYGGMVYSVTDPDQLMEQILAIDPKSLYGKDSQQVAVDKVVSKIVPQATSDAPADTALPEPTIGEVVLPDTSATTTDASASVRTTTDPTPNTLSTVFDETLKAPSEEFLTTTSTPSVSEAVADAIATSTDAATTTSP